MAKRIIIASKNKGKIREFNQIFPDCEFVPYSDLGITEEPEETGNTFYENALIKAKTISEMTGETVIADDSGLCVDYLDGAPSVYSARFSGQGDKANNEKVLRLLEGVPDEKRGAHFTSCIVLYSPDKTVVSAECQTQGRILYETTGENGFGYDAIFFSTEIGKPFGLATAEEKNSVSHRGKALRKLRELLK
ncbi:MAG: RdgB/HAM1 family non-canonical purine NTP pyrophosphatase [Clostridia bacterium]|nr:RdgB/HAM1 family non-canonical purine NTP pyrophosphatase [Clostridia bacterium]